MVCRSQYDCVCSSFSRSWRSYVGSVVFGLLSQESELLSSKVGAECDSCDAEAGEGASEALESGEGASVPPLLTASA